MIQVKRFEEIVKKELVEEITPFLMELRAKEKQGLVKCIQKIHEEYSVFHDNVCPRTENQDHIIWTAQFFCLTRRQYTSAYTSIVQNEVNKINVAIKYFVPKWFSDYINLNVGPWRIDYLWIIELSKKGILVPDTALIAQTLVRIVEKHKKIDTSKLHLHDETLKDHIWLFFKEQTDIYEIDEWSHTIIELSNNKTIDRQKLLISCL